MLLLKAPAPALGVACILICLTGCGKSKGTVSGKVTLDGKPLQFGSVTLSAQDGPTLFADIQRDGTYSIDDVPFGKVSAAVSSPDPNPPDMTGKVPPGFKHPLKDLPARPKVDATGWFPIPVDYASLSKSGLSLTVNQKKTVFDIALKDPEPAPPE